MRYKYKGIYKKRGTLGIFIYDSVKDRVITPVVQFSIEDAWYIPKLDKEYFGNIGKKKKGNGHGWLMGWLFFYVGVCISERGID